LLEAGLFWLSPTPDVPSRGWGIDEYELSARWVKLRDRASRTSFVHLNTHFEDGAWGEQSRQESSKLVCSRLDQLQTGELPALVTGDFNCNPWDPAYRIFMGNGFTDAYRAAGNADTEASSTFHGFRGSGYFGLEWGGSIFWRVDWILTRDGAQRVQTVASTIVRDAEPPLYPSDHYPVVAEVMFLSNG
jgi:endonuclease/exonuclease/phosphatase family metal-dependent hydrolase